MKISKQVKAAIIIGVCGIIAAIIGALITTYKVKTIEIYLTNKETNQVISGQIFIDTDKDGMPSNPASPAIIRVKRGDRYIRAESDNYKPELVLIDRAAKTLTIPMEMTAVAVVTGPTPLSFAGRSLWSTKITISEGESANEIIVNGTFDDAEGFFISGLPVAMRGRTLILHFSNTRASRFSRSRMIKVAYNADDILLTPNNASMMNGEYITAEDTLPDNGVEFTIPENFNGRLNFVFYGATLDNLIIRAFYR